MRKSIAPLRTLLSRLTAGSSYSHPFHSTNWIDSNWLQLFRRLEQNEPRKHNDPVIGVTSVLLTPKAFANFSPWLERSDNLWITSTKSVNPERVRLERNPFRVVDYEIGLPPGVLLCSNPRLKFANAFGA